MNMQKILPILFAVCLCLAVSCHKENPVNNNNPHDTTTHKDTLIHIDTCNVTGTWAVTYTGNPNFSADMVLSYNGGYFYATSTGIVCPGGSAYGTFDVKTNSFQLHNLSNGYFWDWYGQVDSKCNAFDGVYEKFDNYNGSNESWLFKAVRK